MNTGILNQSFIPLKRIYFLEEVTMKVRYRKAELVKLDIQ
jgi:hypothetical protein